MRYSGKLTVEGVIGGFATRATRGPGNASVVQREFLSSEDGFTLVQRLEEISRIFVRPFLPPHPQIEPQIAFLFIVLRRDNSFDAWVNEGEVIFEMQAKGDVAAGQIISTDDIADVRSVKVPAIAVGPEDAYFIVFSSGWRKGFLYDVSSLHVAAPDRDLGKDLGAAYAYLLFQERFDVSDEAWARLFAEKWFPFTSLTHELIVKMVTHAKEGWSVDELLPEIVAEVQRSLPAFRRFVNGSPFLAPHAKILSEVAEVYERGQYAVAASAIYPRIEGMLRQEIAKRGGRANQADMTRVPTTVSDHRLPHSLLLPARFEAYLRDVVFAREDFSNPGRVQHVTRHSIAHGVAPQERLDEKAATIGLLIVRHLALLLSR